MVGDVFQSQVEVVATVVEEMEEVATVEEERAP